MTNEPTERTDRDIFAELNEATHGEASRESEALLEQARADMNQPSRFFPDPLCIYCGKTFITWETAKLSKGKTELACQSCGKVSPVAIK